MSLDKAISVVRELIAKIEQHTGVSAVPKQKEAKPRAVSEAKAELPAIVQCFAKCDLHVTQIVECQRVDYSDKLLLCKLRVSANEVRTFAAGIGPWYSPEELVGKKIVTILNLKPRPMAEGRIVSEAMLFAGSYDDHNVVKLCIPDQGVEVGTRVVVEGFPELPAADGQPKKNFDKVLEVLKCKGKCMCLDGMKLLAGGKEIFVDCPDDCQLG